MPSSRFAAHRLIILAAAGLLLVSCAAPLRPPGGTLGEAIGAQQQFVSEVNAYRVQHGLAAIPQSPSLMKVARAHLRDLELRYQRGSQCNMHSWSTDGNWSSCCYTPDHAAAACMWNKPREITGGRYTAPGYEIVAHYTDPISPTRALEIWRGSPPHHAMLLNTGQWHDNTWRALGAAIGRHYAVVWFAEAADPTSD